MRKDWVVWCTCALLFSAGAIWGGVPLDIKFFKVANIHDLFEIFSSAATVVAVGLALISVNTWRQQVSAEADHALAQRVAVAALKYKEVSRGAFGDAQFAVTQFKYGVDDLPDGMLERFTTGMEVRLQERQQAKAEFLAVLLEARAIWGVEFSKKYDDLLNFTENFYGCLRTFFAWIRLDKDEEYAQGFSRSMARYYEQFDKENWLIVTDAQISRFDSVTQAADDELRRKMLKSG